MKLKDFLEHHEIPVVKLAEMTGLSVVSIRNYINGTMPSVENAFKIERATLGVVKAKDFADRKKGTE